MILFSKFLNSLHCLNKGVLNILNLESNGIGNFVDAIDKVEVASHAAET